MNSNITENTVTQDKELRGTKTRQTMEGLWLNYYNNTLYREGLLTKDEYDRMQRLITRRKDDFLKM